MEANANPSGQVYCDQSASSQKSNEQQNVVSQMHARWSVGLKIRKWLGSCYSASEKAGQYYNIVGEFTSIINRVKTTTNAV